MQTTPRRKVRHSLRRFLARLSGRYYWEDFVRVYPDGLAFDRKGRPREPSRNDINNFLNHRKFYRFSAQFARGRQVADIGCGSGYGCAVLKEAGAARVCGADLSRAAIGYARDRYGGAAEFSVQKITRLRYADRTFDLTVCSEVLEHVKEYGREERALRELRRITRKQGLIVLGTPNAELLPDHGFSFDEMDELLRRHFARFCLFENALVPHEPRGRSSWELRAAQGRVGRIVSQRIDLGETCLWEGQVPEIKAGEAPGILPLGPVQVRTETLHNTHSWVAVAVNG